MQNKRDVIASVLLIIIGIAVIIWAFRLQVGTLLRPLAGFFPLLVGVAVIVLSLVLLSRGGSGAEKRPRPSADGRNRSSCSQRWAFMPFFWNHWGTSRRRSS